MLNMLGALDNPNSGEIIIDGINLGNEKDLSDFRRDTLGFIFQLHNLLPNLSVQENVEIPLVRTKLSEKEKEKRALTYEASKLLVFWTKKITKQINYQEDNIKE